MSGEPFEKPALTASGVHDAYAAIASVYDAVTAAFLAGARRELCNTCHRIGARRILDVGCGTGLLAKLLGNRFDFVVGIDSSPAMLKKAAASCASATFIRADAAFPPLLPGSFDVLTYAMILHETSADAERLLRQGFSLAPLALALDWRMPERNLDYLTTFWIPFVERLAGKEHFRQYRRFMREGGLPGLAERAGAEILYEQTLCANSLAVVLLQSGQR